LRRAVLTNFVRDDCSRLSVNERDDKGWLFLVPIKVNSSSISKVLTLPGTGRVSFCARSPA